MTSTHELAPGRLIDLHAEVLGVTHHTRHAVLVDQEPGRPPCRIDGFTVGAPRITADAPHDGEVHPDGDEVLYLLREPGRLLPITPGPGPGGDARPLPPDSDGSDGSDGSDDGGVR